MTTPITLPPLDEQSLSDLRHRYDEASDAETRTRYQMLLLSAKGQTSTQIARLVLRSQDTVVRVLKRIKKGYKEASANIVNLLSYLRKSGKSEVKNNPEE